VILDISNPTAPMPLATIALPGASPADAAMAASDHFIVADANLGLMIFDATMPTSPVLLGSLALPGTPRRLGGANVVLAVACGSAGVQLVDVNAAMNPLPAGSIPGHAYDVVDRLFDYLIATGNILAVAATDCRNIAPVGVAPLDVTPAPLQLSASPNPFNPRTVVSFAVARASAVRLAVYDLAGRKVVDLLGATVSAGEHRITWDGRDSCGRAMPSGNYVVQLTTQERTHSRTVTLLR
jgi:hypothetical protein